MMSNTCVHTEFHINISALHMINRPSVSCAVY